MRLLPGQSSGNLEKTVGNVWNLGLKITDHPALNSEKGVTNL